MSHETSTEEASALPQASVSNSCSQSDKADADVSPPSPSQLRTELGSSDPATSGPGDSAALPKVHEDLLNDGIADQVSRRAHRLPVVIAALTVLILFTLCLTGIVGTLGYSFYRALEPENIARFTALELKEKVNKATTDLSENPDTSSKAGKGVDSSSKDTKNAKAKTADENGHTKAIEPIKVEAKIYGEIRDSMVPLVALVSILTVAVVVILGTILKAAFAPHPNHNPDQKETEETSPLPLLQALKELVESVKAAWK